MEHPGPEYERRTMLGVRLHPDMVAEAKALAADTGHTLTTLVETLLAGLLTEHGRPAPSARLKKEVAA